MRGALMAMLAGMLAANAWGAIARVAADETRYFEQGGITYRERIATVKVPVAETQYKDQQVTVCRENYATQLVDQTRKVNLPVTEYRWEQRTHGLWPFSTPHTAWHYVPYTRYQTQVQTTKVPVNVRSYVPETRTVKVPETNVKLVEQQRVVERVAMTPVPVPLGPWGAGPQFARAPAPLSPTPAGPIAAPNVSPTPAPNLVSPPPGNLAPAPSNISLAPPPAASGGNQSVLASRPPAVAPLVAVPTQPQLQPVPRYAYPAYAYPPGYNPYAAAPPVAREQIGGISRLESDPPRLPATDLRR